MSNETTITAAQSLDLDLRSIARKERTEWRSIDDLTRAAAERLDQESGLRESFKCALWFRIVREERRSA